VVSLLNFIVFFFTQKKRLVSRYSHRKSFSFNRTTGAPTGAGSSSYNMGSTSAQREFGKGAAAPKASKKVTRHKCAICGKTEESDPNMSFRFCSKCNGNYEYCENHLFTHMHVE